MGFPHPTPDLPGKWPALRAEVIAVRIPTQESQTLLQLLDTDAPELLEPAHICATAWVLSQDHCHTLLVQHSTLGWSTPGGHLNQHETSRNGALRELLEETGLDAAAVQISVTLLQSFTSTAPQEKYLISIGTLDGSTLATLPHHSPQSMTLGGGRLTNCPQDQKIVALFFRKYFNFYHGKSFVVLGNPYRGG